MVAFSAQGAKVFISYFREATNYSDEELAVAKTRAIGGDKLYRAFQQQTSDKLVEGIRSAGGQAVAMEVIWVMSPASRRSSTHVRRRLAPGGCANQ